MRIVCKKEKQPPKTSVGIESCFFCCLARIRTQTSSARNWCATITLQGNIFSKDKGSIFFRNDKNIFLINFVVTTKKHIIFHQQAINE